MTNMKIDLSQTSPEVRAALIEAASRVYAGGLIGSNYSPECMRREEARAAVEDFFSVLKKMSW